MGTVHPHTAVRLREASLTGLVLSWIGCIFALFPGLDGGTKGTGFETALLGFALLASLQSLARLVPWQNVAAIGVLTCLVAGSAFGGVAHESFPGQPLTYGPGLEASLFHLLPWSVPVLWVALFATTLGVARLVLWPYRHRDDYGFWLIGLNTVLVGLFAAGFEVFATHVQFYWQWRVSDVRWSWRGIPWLALGLWMGVALLIHILATPWLVSKRPVEAKPDFAPLLVWFLVLMWILAGNATRGWTGEAAVTLGTMVLVSSLALKGAIGRRSSPCFQHS